MTIDEVMQAAQDAEDLRILEVVRFVKGGAVPPPDAHDALIAKLRAAIAAYGAAERERCAVVCESEPERLGGDGIYRCDQKACAEAIRALD